LIAIVLPSIAFFAKARQPKTKPRIIASNQPPSLPVNNANQGNAIAGQGDRRQKLVKRGLATTKQLLILVLSPPGQDNQNYDANDRYRGLGLFSRQSERPAC
jgi:hypothetical protein